ncbi:hypothetical protein [Flavobacterium sp.]|uniref:hypothetical protein n=1 Tax=Flavobacterium sp. TaxID=239 RepID=UPI0025BB55B2|nr:hypothetical protein [Flavobacterium sp.]MBA4154153.1 hypothetical protein [Flavobacterium sp.]
MEIIENFKNLADDKRYIEDLREVVMNDTFYQPTENMFTIVPGIKGGQQVAAMRGFEYITKKSAGCGGDGISPTFPAFSQFWNPTLQEVKIQYCYKDFETSFVQWGLKNGYARKDLTGTELGVFIQYLVSKAIALDLQRIVLMADKDIAAQNILTDEVTKVQFYNTIDKGLIPTLAYLKTLPEFAEAFVELSKNTGAQSVQLALDADYAVNLYESITDDVYDFDADLFLTSNRLFKNYTKWIKRNNGYGLQSNVDLTQKGVKDANVDGEKLVPVVHYDRWKKADFVTGVAPADTIHLPHFALLTRKEYLQVGVDDEASLTDITLEYVGGKEETFWIKANFMLDFKMTNPYAMKAAL